MESNGNVVVFENLDRIEFLFKNALFHKDGKLIKQLLSKHKQLGNSLVGYLY